MLLSCSPLIRINGSHDTALHFSLIQLLLGSHLTFSRVSQPPNTKKACVEIEVFLISRHLSFKTGQPFVVFRTFSQCLMFLQSFLTPVQKVYWSKRLLFNVIFPTNSAEVPALMLDDIQCVERSVCTKLCLCIS